tara:strand:- start:1149 stop:1379 length:231 start_codon:yes stop_codon:yes gene_type:complete
MIKTVELDGKMIAYTDQTEFLVEVGRYRAAYKTRWRFVGNIHEAVRYYRGLNIGRGYKKRLRAPSFNKPVLARYIS